MERIVSVEKLRLKFPGDESLIFKDLSSRLIKVKKCYCWDRPDVESPLCCKC